MRRNDAYVESLSRVPMLRACTRDELHRVAKLAEHHTTTAGEVLVREGETGHEFYVLLSGKAEVQRAGTVVATLGAGDCFGELALLDPHPRSATVTVVEAGETLLLEQRAFWGLLEDAPNITRRLLMTLAKRLHEAADADPTSARG